MPDIAPTAEMRQAKWFRTSVTLLVAMIALSSLSGLREQPASAYVLLAAVLVGGFLLLLLAEGSTISISKLVITVASTTAAVVLATVIGTAFGVVKHLQCVVYDRGDVVTVTEDITVEGLTISRDFKSCYIDEISSWRL